MADLYNTNQIVFLSYVVSVRNHKKDKHKKKKQVLKGMWRSWAENVLKIGVKILSNDIIHLTLA